MMFHFMLERREANNFYEANVERRISTELCIDSEGAQKGIEKIPLANSLAIFIVSNLMFSNNRTKESLTTE